MFPTLVSCEWLRDHIQRSAIRIFDCTIYSTLSLVDAQARFVERHIPSASQLLLRLDPAKTGENIFDIIPKASAFSKCVTDAGISRGLHCVLYDTDGLSAYRVWWLLNYFSHPTVSLFTGGLAEWCDKGLQTESGPVPALYAAPRTAFSAQPTPSLVVSALSVMRYVKEREAASPSETPAKFPQFFTRIEQTDNMLDETSMVVRLGLGASGSDEAAGASIQQLVDVRVVQAEAKGDADQDNTEASLPHAAHIPYLSFLDDNGRISTDVTLLRSHFHAVGVDVSQPITFFGRNGVELSIAVLAAFLCSGQNIRRFSICRDAALGGSVLDGSQAGDTNKDSAA